MGCGNPKEKVEDEMMKMKMKRIELQMERYNQLQLLKEIDGSEIKPPVIPDYLDPKYTNNNNCIKPSLTGVKNTNAKTRRRPGRSKSTKIFGLAQKKTKIFNMDEENKESKENLSIRKSKKRITKRKTMNY